MNIGGIQFPVFNPYQKSTVEIYISGCTRNCKGCHNAELKDFNYGVPYNFNKLNNYLQARKDLFQIISIVGGDLLCQDEQEALQFVKDLKTTFNKEMWLFTGATKAQCPKWVFEMFDLVKVGPFIERLYNDANKFPATPNQKVLRKGKDY